jgi:hypothetical protein
VLARYQHKKTLAGRAECLRRSLPELKPTLTEQSRRSDCQILSSSNFTTSPKFLPSKESTLNSHFSLLYSFRSGEGNTPIRVFFCVDSI